MAGNKPGPAKGSGGRPRKPSGSKLTKGPNKGYTKVTVGPPGKGRQVYKHRQVAGAGRGSKTGGTVVHHKDGNKANNSKSNLAGISRREHPKKKDARGRRA